jgi:hypothetical protein
MAATDLKFRIGADIAEIKAALASIKAEFAGIGQAASKVNQGAALDSMAGSASVAATAIKGLVAGFAALSAVGGFAAVIRQGVEFNKTLETSELGIASLIAAQSKLVDAQGKAVEGQEALAVAIGLSKQQMFQLRIAGLETAATTTQLVEAFQQAVGPGLTAGLNLDEVRKITVQIVQAAGALGVPMAQVAQEVRAILDGSIDINARVAKSLGITNEQVKTWREQGTLVEELNKRMEAFTIAGQRAADTFEVIKSNTQEAFESLSGEIAAGYFEQIKGALKDATTGIFDTKTLGITDAFKDLISLLREITTLIGGGVAGAIRGVVDLAKEFSGYIRENRADLSELAQSVGFLLSQFGQLVGAALSLVGIVGDVGVKTSAFSKVLQTVGVMVAGIQDGFRTIAAVVVGVGSVIISAVLSPVEKLFALLASGVALVDKATAAKLNDIRRQIGEVGSRGFQAAGDILKPIKDGTGAVATAIKDINKLQAAAAKAGQEQKKTGAGAVGSASSKGGSGGGDSKAVKIPDLLKTLDEAFRLQSDALKRESKALDQALEDRLISIKQWHADKADIANQDFTLQREKLERERAELVAHLAKLGGLKAGKEGDAERISKETLKTKNDIAKIDADLIILERERADTVGEIGRRGKKAEEDYQRALEDTRIALLRARGLDLEASLAEIERQYKDALKRFAGDAEALDLVGKLFNAQRAQAQIDDVKNRLSQTIGELRSNEALISAQTDAGLLPALEAERQLQTLRDRSIAQLKDYRDVLAAIAAAQTVSGGIADPRVLELLRQTDTEIARVTASQRTLQTQIEQSAQSSIMGFFNDLATGARSFSDAIKAAALSFIQSLARMAAEALAKKALLSLGGSGGGGVFSWLASIFHTGGIVGGGGTSRAVNPLVFAGAPRYHSGGLVGLKPDERPAILQTGEEVLSRRDPRNALNGGSGTPASGGTRIINVIDPSLVSDYMSSSAGEKTVLNILQRNPGAVRQVLA